MGPIVVVNLRLGWLPGNSLMPRLSTFSLILASIPFLHTLRDSIARPGLLSRVSFPHWAYRLLFTIHFIWTYINLRLYRVGSAIPYLPKGLFGGSTHASI